MKKIVLFTVLVFVLAGSVLLYAGAVWRDDFEKIVNWYDNKTDASFNAVITAGKKAGTAEVVQKGKSTWGKVAFVVTDIDVDRFNTIRVKVNKVEKNGDYKILVSSITWDKSFIVIDRGKGKGTHEGSIKEAAPWKGKMSFNVVILVEGKDKKVTLDWIELASRENEEPEEEE